MFQDIKQQTKEAKLLSNIPTDIIQLCVSNCSSEILTEDTLQLISDYCSHKLIQVLKSALDAKKFSGRSKFTVADFSRGLYVNEEAPVEFEMLTLPQGRKRKRKCSNLSNSNSRIKNKNVEPVIIDSLWLSDIVLSGENINVLPSEFQVYFHTATSVLASRNEKVCSKFIQDFQTNKCISTLMPYFVKYFLSNINNISHDNIKMSIYLNALSALLSNSYLYFDHQLISTELVCVVLKVLISDSPHSDYQSWSLKDTAATVLVQILKRKKSLKFFLGILQDLKSILCDLHKPLISHYGAIVALNSFGVPAIKIAILPHINKYFEYLNELYASNIQKRYDIKIIQGQLIQSYYLLTYYYFKNKFNNFSNVNIEHCLGLPFYYFELLKNVKVLSLLSQCDFVDVYGDSLVPYFPFLNYLSYPGNNKANMHKKHQFPRGNISTEHSTTSSAVLMCNNKVNETVVKLIKSKNLNGKKIVSKNRYARGNKSFNIASDAVKLDSKISHKYSRDQIFDDIPLKNSVIKFSKMKGL